MSNLSPVELYSTRWAFRRLYKKADDLVESIQEMEGQREELIKWLGPPNGPANFADQRLSEVEIALSIKQDELAHLLVLLELERLRV